MSESKTLSQGTAIAVLAAGSGLRFGSDKLKVDCAGRPLAEWAIATALGFGVPVAVVVQSGRPLATASSDDPGDLIIAEKLLVRDLAASMR